MFDGAKVIKKYEIANWRSLFKIIRNPEGNKTDYVEL